MNRAVQQGACGSKIAEIGGKTRHCAGYCIEAHLPKELLNLKRFKDHALFVAFAPVLDPRIAVSVVVEHGGKGALLLPSIAKNYRGLS